MISEARQEQLTNLARHIDEGKVFTTWHLKAPDDVHFVWGLILMGMNDTMRKQMVDDQVTFLYEYIDKAGPRAINDYPMFFSMQYANREEELFLIEAVKTWKERRKKLEEMLDAVEREKRG